MWRSMGVSFTSGGILQGQRSSGVAGAVKELPTCDKQEGVRTVGGLQGGPSCEKGLQCSTRAEHMAGIVCCVVACSRVPPFSLLLVGQYQGCVGCRAGGTHFGMKCSA